MTEETPVEIIDDVFNEMCNLFLRKENLQSYVAQFFKRALSDNLDLDIRVELRTLIDNWLQSTVAGNGPKITQFIDNVKDLIELDKEKRLQYVERSLDKSKYN
jgi:hypothetical protein